MNVFKKAYCRAYQKVIFLVQNLLHFPVPETLEGSGALSLVAEKLQKEGKSHPLILATPSMIRNGYLPKLTKPLEEKGIAYEVFTKIEPNPPFPIVEEAYAIFASCSCDCLVALGGGSTLDTAKAVGAKTTNPKKSLAKFKGVLKVGKKIPYLVAIPSTAGSGSEATVAAVVVNPENHDKFSISDPHLIPSLAVLDADLLASLPQKLIAYTGMDALTHALESYLGKAGTSLSKKTALEAMELIRDNLLDFYFDPSLASARQGMQKAAFLAGVSFTRGYVGYVHALAHSLGGLYGVAHGYANAVLLPHVLEAYGQSAEKKLAKAASFLKLAPENSTRTEQADALISWVKELNEKMGIPDKFADLIRDEDLDKLALHADKEANPLYPVPKEMSQKELKKILLEVKES